MGLFTIHDLILRGQVGLEKSKFLEKNFKIPIWLGSSGSKLLGC